MKANVIEADVNNILLFEVESRMKDEAFKEIHQEITSQNLGKIKSASTLSKDSVIYSMQASRYYGQAGTAYAQGDTEKGKYFESLGAAYAKAISPSLAALMATSEAAAAARKKNEIDIVQYWQKLALSYQELADLRGQAALAWNEDQKEKAQALDKQASLLESEKNG